VTEQQAIALCEKRSRELNIDEDMQPESAVKAIVEFKQDPNSPGPTEDRIAWIVIYKCDWGMVEVHVDDRTEEVLTVRRTA
jgi:hypothetical protein